MKKRKVIGIMCAVTLLIGNVANAEPTVVLDRTGSMADQPKVEAALLDALVKYGARRGAFRLIPFSDRVLNVPPEIVKWTVVDGWQSQIGALSAVQSEQLADRARAALGPMLNAPPIAPAKVTNVPAVLARAGRERGGALVVFDGKNEVPTSLKPVTQARFQVVLCASQGDNGAHELQIAQRRENEIRHWAPNAAIFACAEMDEAVKDLLAANVSNNFRAVTAKR